MSQACNYVACFHISKPHIVKDPDQILWACGREGCWAWGTQHPFRVASPETFETVPINWVPTLYSRHSLRVIPTKLHTEAILMRSLIYISNFSTKNVKTVIIIMVMKQRQGHMQTLNIITTCTQSLFAKMSDPMNACYAYYTSHTTNIQVWSLSPYWAYQCLTTLVSVTLHSSSIRWSGKESKF